MQQSFPKTERLTHKKHIDSLFDKANSANKGKTCYPFRVILTFATASDQQFPKVLISVSKRNFKKAVDRNLLKRRTREAYRLNKNLIEYKKVERIAFLYIGRAIESYTVIEKGMLKGLKFILEESDSHLNNI